MPRHQNTLCGIKCTLRLSKCNWLPITFSILESIFKLLTLSHSLDIDHDMVMLWAAFSLAFFGFSRWSELTCNGQFDCNVRTSAVRALPFSRTSLVHNTWKSALRSPRQTHSGKLQLSVSPVHNPTSAQGPPQEICSFRCPTPPRKVPCSSLRMAHVSHDVPWAWTYTP